jgi:UDP-N-acetylglucosamine 2-epimerase
VKKLKVATIVGTRPEIIRLSRVISNLREHCDHTLIHTGQNFDHQLSQVFFDDLEIGAPDIQLNAARSTPTQTIAAVLEATDKCLRGLSPDAVIVLGDTNSGLSLLSAKRLGIPTFHMEAGNRCFDSRVPEETNRRIIDHLADVNLPYSQIAREHLLREGVPSQRVIVTGSPMPEVLEFYRPKIETSAIVDTLNLSVGNYYVVSLHREENVDNADCLARFVFVLNTIAQDHELPIVVSTHPRTRKRLGDLQLKLHKKIQLAEPFSFTDYVKLQLHSRAVLSDSGTISEEASILGLPAVNLRFTHERPEAMEEAAVIMVGSNHERVMQALSILEAAKRQKPNVSKVPYDYQSMNVAEKVCRILHSYVDVVQRSRIQA